MSLNPTNLAAKTAKSLTNGNNVGGGQTFSGATPAATPATSSTPFGFAEAQANALLTSVREMRAALIAAGIIADNA